MTDLTILREWHSQGASYRPLYLKPPERDVGERLAVWRRDLEHYEAFLNGELVGVLADFERVARFLAGEEVS